jgi:hypothetical protein
LWSLSSPGGALTPSGGRGGALTTTTTPSPVTASRLAIAMRNNHGRRCRANTAFFSLNPALSGKKEEDDKKEEDREKNKGVQMPTFLDWRCIGSNAGEKLAQGIVQHGTHIERGMVHIERGMVNIERGITRLGILLALGIVLLGCLLVLAARWTEVGNLLATCSKIIFANKMFMVASKRIMLAAIAIVLGAVFAVCLRVAVDILKWGGVDLKSLWSSSSWWHKGTRSKEETK